MASQPQWRPQYNNFLGFRNCICSNWFTHILSQYNASQYNHNHNLKFSNGNIKSEKDEFIENYYQQIQMQAQFRLWKMFPQWRRRRRESYFSVQVMAGNKHCHSYCCLLLKTVTKQKKKKNIIDWVNFFILIISK